jgi:hypothetical protein
MRLATELAGRDRACPGQSATRPPHKGDEFRNAHGTVLGKDRVGWARTFPGSVTVGRRRGCVRTGRRKGKLVMSAVT